MKDTILIKSFVAASLISALLYSAQSNAALPAQVYSIPSTSKALFNTGSVSVSTITKGYTAANDPVFRTVVQNIPIALFSTVARSAVRFSPYGIAAMIAYDFIFDEETGEIMANGSTYTSGSIDDDARGGCEFRNSFGAQSGADYTYARCAAAGVYKGVPISTYSYDESAGKFIGLPSSGSGYFKFKPYSSSDLPTTEKTVASDQELFDALSAYSQLNPDADSRDLFLNADGSVNQDYFPDPDFSLNTQSELDLADLYGAGLLQSTDPAADNYVTPQQYSDAKSLYESLNQTSEETASELTDLESLPMTRDEYAQEQALKEARMEAEGTNIDGIDIEKLDRAEEMDEQFNILDTAMTGINDSSLPSVLPDLPKFDYSSGCQTVELFTLTGTINFPNASQCSKLGVMKDLLSYFLYVVFFWIITVQLLKEAN